MKELNFDLYAMVNPKNSRDQAAMLNEAISELQNINARLDALLSEDKCAAPVHA
jgi:hypothetical protein